MPAAHHTFSYAKVSTSHSMTKGFILVNKITFNKCGVSTIITDKNIMNKILLTLIVVSACYNNAIAQPDTNLYQTSTSQNVAAWLKNLSLPAGAGHISILDPQMGALLISPNGRNYVKNNSMAAYYQTTTLFNTDLNLAGQSLRSDFRNMQRAGVFMARSPSFMPWGVIEPVQGSAYHYEFIDSTR